MARTNKVFDATVDEVEEAKQSVVLLMHDNFKQTALDLFYTDNLEEVENRIKQLNEFSNKSWLLSSIVMYSIIYSNSLYLESGLTWNEYTKQARERLGLDPRDISEQLSAARFFITNHAELERQGFDPAGNNRKLARAELATELCGDVHETIQHLVHDTWAEYNDWYSSFKSTKALPKPTEYKREDIDIQGNRVYIQGIEAVKVSDKIPEQDKERIEKYLGQIFEAIRKGYEPAVVDCYDEKEARNLVNLRDKYRQRR